MAAWDSVDVDWGWLLDWLRTTYNWLLIVHIIMSNSGLIKIKPSNLQESLPGWRSLCEEPWRWGVLRERKPDATWCVRQRPVMTGDWEEESFGLMKRGERWWLAGRELALVSRLDSGLSPRPGERRDWVCPLTWSHPDNVLFTNNKYYRSLDSGPTLAPSHTLNWLTAARASRPKWYFLSDSNYRHKLEIKVCNQFPNPFWDRVESGKGASSFLPARLIFRHDRHFQWWLFIYCF